jgi:hypothetical protein
MLQSHDEGDESNGEEGPAIVKTKFHQRFLDSTIKVTDFEDFFLVAIRVWVLLADQRINCHHEEFAIKKAPMN